MDTDRFDALTRRLSSRRTALAGLLGGLTAVLGLGLGIEEAIAHNPVLACKKIAVPKRRQACLRRARRHNRRQHSCKPRPKAVTCANRCGTARNNCKKPVACTCPAGKACLINHGCNRTCSLAPSIPCPAGCAPCGLQEREAPSATTFQCYPATVTSCAQVPQPCVTSANCALGHFCAAVDCDATGTGRCFPNCLI